MTEAIRKAVALLPDMRTLRAACDEDFYFGRADFLTLIAALEDMQGVADGTDAVVPTHRVLPTDEMIEEMISKAQEK
jgi:hypothetical protein